MRESVWAQVSGRFSAEVHANDPGTCRTAVRVRSRNTSLGVRRRANRKTARGSTRNGTVRWLGRKRRTTTAGNEYRFRRMQTTSRVNACAAVKLAPWPELNLYPSADLRKKSKNSIRGFGPAARYDFSLFIRPNRPYVYHVHLRANRARFRHSRLISRDEPH
jgi:hypothetical protein